MPVHLSAAPVLTLYLPGLQSPVTLLSEADVQVTVEPAAAPSTVVHVVHLSAAPAVLTLYVPAPQSPMTRLLEADVQVTVDPAAAPSTVAQASQPAE